MEVMTGWTPQALPFAGQESPEDDGVACVAANQAPRLWATR
jgi:hypothetical protein